MKKSGFVLILAGMLVCIRAEVATTVPGGVIKITLPAGAPGTPSYTAVGISLQKEPDYSGVLTGVGTTLNDSTATWGPNVYANPSAPFMIRITSGNGVGRYFKISSHTSNQLTVVNDGISLNSIINVGDHYEICAFDTLGSFFGTTSVDLQTGTSAATADMVRVWNGTSWGTYFHDGSSWKKTGSFTTQNNTILPPDRGFFICHRALTPLTLIFTGQVPVTMLKTSVIGKSSTFLANRFPVDVTLKSSGISSLAGWKSGNSAFTADTLQVWNGISWVSYFYNGTSWMKTGSFTTQDNTGIPAGSAVMITRQSDAAGESATLTQNLTYTP